jgi:sulfite exporter TauE/SafE
MARGMMAPSERKALRRAIIISALIYLIPVPDTGDFLPLPLGYAFLAAAYHIGSLGINTDSVLGFLVLFGAGGGVQLFATGLFYYILDSEFRGRWLVVLGLIPITFVCLIIVYVLAAIVAENLL